MFRPVDSWLGARMGGLLLDTDQSASPNFVGEVLFCEGPAYAIKLCERGWPTGVLESRSLTRLSRLSESADS